MDFSLAVDELVIFSEQLVLQRLNLNLVVFRGVGAVVVELRLNILS